MKPVPPSIPVHPPETKVPMIRNVEKGFYRNGMLNNELSAGKGFFYIIKRVHILLYDERVKIYFCGTDGFFFVLSIYCLKDI